MGALRDRLLGHDGDGLFCIGQGRARFCRILGDDEGIAAFGNVRQRTEGQAVADRAVACHQKDLAPAQIPDFGHPPAGRTRLPALDREHIASGRRQAAFEHARNAGAFLGIRQFGVFGCHVGRQIALFDDPFRRVLKGGQNVLRGHVKVRGNGREQGLGVGGPHIFVSVFLRQQVGVMPDRLPVLAPIQRKGPARQGLARIPLALTIVQQPAGRKLVLKAAHQLVCQSALGWADGIRIPFGTFEIVDRDESWLAAHGQTHIPRLKALVDSVAERVQRLPGVIGKRLGDARMLCGSDHLHVEGKIDLCHAGRAGNRGGMAVMGSGCQRNMALAGQQSRGRIKADPACAGQVDLDPGMQVGEILVGARRAVKGDQVGFELDQIARHKARGDPEIAQHLHQQPTGIATRSGSAAQSGFSTLNPWLHADFVCDVLRQTHVQPDKKVNRDHRRARHRRKECAKQGPHGIAVQIDAQVRGDVVIVGKGEILGAFFDKEIKRVVDRHIRNQVHLDLELADGFGKHEPGQPVAVRVLLVVHEMCSGRHGEAVRYDGGTRMRCGTQAD